MRRHLHLGYFVIFALSICAASLPLHAQVLPSSFNYQGRLTDTAGTPLPNGDYQMIFSIWDTKVGGSQLWGSGNKTVTLNKGLFTASLGPIPSAVLSSADVFLQVQMGTDTPMPRIALGAVPFAIKAAELFWPAVATIASSNPVLSLSNSGAGAALMAMNTGSGVAGYFKINNPSSGGSAVLASTNGTGAAIEASTNGNGSAVSATTNGSGAGVKGVATGSGNAARFETTGTADLTTLVVRNQAVGGAAYFDSVGGAANTLISHTTGNGSAGVFDIAKAANTQPSLLAQTTGSGPAIKAVPGSGLAGLFDGILQATTLKLPSGAADGYVLGSDAAGIASWRRDGLTLPYTTTASTDDATISLTNSGKGKTMLLGIDNVNSSAPTLHITGNQKGPGLLVDGQAQVGGFKMAAGANSGYLLKSDAGGVGSWQRADTFTDITASGNIKTWGLEVDSAGVNTGTLNSGGVHFGVASGEGIFSKRSPGGNQFGLDIATNHIPRISITGTGNVGIGVAVPALKFHMQGSQTGNYTTPLSYIENTNATGNSSPAMRLGGSGNSADGVLNISNFGTGKIAVFGGNGGEVASIDVNGSISAKNLPAVRFQMHTDYVNWNDGDLKYLETATVTAPGNGYFVLDGAVNQRGDSSAGSPAMFKLTLFDTSVPGNHVYLQHTSYIQETSVSARMDLGQTVSWVVTATRGQTYSFLLQGEYLAGSSPRTFYTRFTSLRVLFVPNSL